MVENASALGSGWIAPWRKRADKLRETLDLESRDGERALDALAFDLRRVWLQQSHAHSTGYLMSPPQGQAKHLPDGKRIGYPYDRWIKPAHLTARLDVLNPAPPGWHGQSLMFANGMSALTTFLQVYRAFADRWLQRPKGHLSLHWFGGYFEIVKAMQLICDDHLHGRKHANQHNFRTAVEKGIADLVLIEPVAAELTLDMFDLEAFIAAWKRRKTKRPCVVLVDSTLSGDTFPLAHLAEALSPNPPALIVEVRSGLKLDQQGLELSNAGMMSLWAPDTEEAHARLKLITHSTRVARTTLGGGLSQNEYAALTVPFFLDRAQLHSHADAVFEHNKLFARRLAETLQPGSGLFADVFHPSLSAARGKLWAKAPYVNVSYRPDDDSARAFLRAILEFEAEARKLTFVPGSSFGFRGHRFEMGFARGLKHSTLRIAMGARAGPSVEGVIELFEDLAAFEDFPALRAAYPEIAKRHPIDRTDEET